MSKTRGDLVDAALQILSNYGLADLSMRRVASAAGIQAASIYWHFSNKQQLLAALSDKILAVRAQTDSPQQWADELRRVLLNYRDAAELVAASLAIGLGSCDLLAEQAAQLRRAGLAKGAEEQTARAYVHFILGHVMQEQARAQAVELAVLADQPTRDDAGFEVGLEVLTKGAAVISES